MDDESSRDFVMEKLLACMMSWDIGVYSIYKCRNTWANIHDYYCMICSTVQLYWYFDGCCIGINYRRCDRILSREKTMRVYFGLLWT